MSDRYADYDSALERDRDIEATEAEMRTEESGGAAMKEYVLGPVESQEGDLTFATELFVDQRHGELVLANIDIVARRGRADIAAGEPPLEVFERTLAFVRGFVSGRFWLIVPPEMDPVGYERAVARGKELAEEYGW